jgi:uncharacterized membrane protein YkvI
MLALCGWAVMDICVRDDVKSYEEFVSNVLGKKLGTAITFIVNIFICVLFCAMLAGAGATVNQAMGISFSAGVAVTAALCFVVLLFGMEGVIKLNAVVAPVMIIAGIFFGLYVMLAQKTEVFNGAVIAVTNNFVWSGVIYSSYNVITAVSILCGMRGLIKNRRSARKAGLLGGLCMCILGIFFTIPLISNFDIVSSFEIPMLALARQHGRLIESIYILTLFSAIFTTAASNAYAASEWLASKIKIKKVYIKAGICLFGSLFSYAGFSAIVGVAYPFFGCLGIFEIIVILIYFLFGGKNE